MPATSGHSCLGFVATRCRHCECALAIKTFPTFPNAPAKSQSKANQQRLTGFLRGWEQAKGKTGQLLAGRVGASRAKPGPMLWQVG